MILEQLGQHGSGSGQQSSGEPGLLDT